MKRNVNILSEEKYDVLVVGCGIYGAATAREAAQRGLKTAVIDSRDFCGATSANSLKIIHGGLRYLQQLDIFRVLESCSERKNMMKIAPHIVHPLACVMPTRSLTMKSRLTMTAAMLMYDTLTFRRNSLKDPEKTIPRGRVISKDECLKIMPGIDTNRLTGAAAWHDAFAQSTERLCISMIQSATVAGAEAANYVKMTGFIANDGTVTGIKAKDMLTNSEIDINADLVILNTGPWTNHVLSQLDRHTTKPIHGLAMGMNIIVNKKIFKEYAVGLSCPKLKGMKERLLFFMPWSEKTMIGTYYRTHDGHPDQLKVNDEDIELFLKDINSAYPAVEISGDDIDMIQTGLLSTRKVPHKTAGHCGGTSFIERDPSLSNHPEIIDHRKSDNINGLLTVVGVKYTTARDVAEKTIDIAFRKLKRQSLPSISASDPLPGGNTDDYNALIAEAERKHIPTDLVKNYGTLYKNIIDQADNYNDTMSAEISYLVDEEMPETLADLIFRRTSIASAGIPERTRLEKIASIMAQKLNWDEKRISEEIRMAEGVIFPGSETF